MRMTDDLPTEGDLLAEKYRVEKVLGAGGFGIVVAARQVALRRRVAIKLLRERAVSLPFATQRFLREAKAAAAIECEHVVKILDVGTLDNKAPYMVMEYLSGVDLAHYVETTGPVPLADAVDFVLQACVAIAEAHALGIVHRDLKPANLFLTRRLDGSPLVKVLDFGLSKMAIGGEDGTEVNLTDTGMVIGTPYYMAPEQVRSLKGLDARADVWAMCVILYELLTGMPPFSGGNPLAVYASIVTDTPSRVRTARPDVPVSLDEVILAGLEKDPARRIQSIAELASKLGRFAPSRSKPLLSHIRRLAAGASAAFVDMDGEIPRETGAEVDDTLPVELVTKRSTDTSSASDGQKDTSQDDQTGLTSVKGMTWGRTTRIRRIGAAGVVLAAGLLVVILVVVLPQIEGSISPAQVPVAQAGQSEHGGAAMVSRPPSPTSSGPHPAQSSSAATSVQVKPAAPAPSARKQQRPETREPPAPTSSTATTTSTSDAGLHAERRHPQ